MAEVATTINGLSRAILAANAIVYMLSQIESVRAELAMVAGVFVTPTEDDAVTQEVLREGAESHKWFINNTANRLAELTEIVGDYMNGSDMTTPEDVEITAAAFKYMQPA